MPLKSQCCGNEPSLATVDLDLSSFSVLDFLNSGGQHDEDGDNVVADGGFDCTENNPAVPITPAQVARSGLDTARAGA